MFFATLFLRFYFSTPRYNFGIDHDSVEHVEPLLGEESWLLQGDESRKAQQPGRQSHNEYVGDSDAFVSNFSANPKSRNGAQLGFLGLMKLYYVLETEVAY